MKTCGECKQDDCGARYSAADVVACDDFTGVELEAKSQWCPTLEDYNMLRARYNDSIHRETILRDRVTHFEQAVAGIIRWAQEEVA